MHLYYLYPDICDIVKQRKAITMYIFVYRKIKISLNVRFVTKYSWLLRFQEATIFTRPQF